jgi:hypothetical protein
MSWWDTGEENDVIGDEPADAVRHALLRIAEEKTRQRRPKPKLSELLRAMGTVALRASKEELLMAGPAPQVIVAELKSGGAESSGTLTDAAEDRELTASLAENLSAVAAIYRSRWGNPPKLSEWLESFAFVLRYRPEEYLEDGGPRAPLKILAAQAPLLRP